MVDAEDPHRDRGSDFVRSLRGSAAISDDGLVHPTRVLVQNPVLEWLYRLAGWQSFRATPQSPEPTLRSVARHSAHIGAARNPEDIPTGAEYIEKGHSPSCTGFEQTALGRQSRFRAAQLGRAGEASYLMNSGARGFEHSRVTSTT